MMALMLAQKKLSHFNLGAKHLPSHRLVTSGRMCAMCLGNVCWSGIKEVISSAEPEDVEGITGFDEGPTPLDYIEQLEARGIKVEYDMPEGVVLFKDANLEKAIRDALGIPTELLKKEDLAGLTSLNLHNLGITNLSGLESCTNLTSINLGDGKNKASDLSPLAGLTKLKDTNYQFICKD